MSIYKTPRTPPPHPSLIPVFQSFLQYNITTLLHEEKCHCIDSALRIMNIDLSSKTDAEYRNITFPFLRFREQKCH